MNRWYFAETEIIYYSFYLSIYVQVWNTLMIYLFEVIFFWKIDKHKNHSNKGLFNTFQSFRIEA